MNLTITSFSLNQEFDKLVKATLAEKQLISNDNDNNKETITPEMTDESAKSPDFFQSNKLSTERTDRKYTTTRIKLRNFLLNISYFGIKKEDFYNENFICDIFLFMTKNLNPFSLDKKLNDPNKHEMICMIWKECMPAQFYKFTCRKENFIYLDGKNVLLPKVSEILANFMAENEKNYVLLRNNLSQYKNIFQYVYLNVFPEEKRIRPQKHIPHCL